MTRFVAVRANISDKVHCAAWLLLALLKPRRIKFLERSLITLCPDND